MRRVGRNIENLRLFADRIAAHTRVEGSSISPEEDPVQTLCRLLSLCRLCGVRTDPLRRILPITRSSAGDSEKTSPPSLNCGYLGEGRASRLTRTDAGRSFSADRRGERARTHGNEPSRDDTSCPASFGSLRRGRRVNPEVVLAESPDLDAVVAMCDLVRAYNRWCSSAGARPDGPSEQGTTPVGSGTGAIGGL